MTGRSVVMTTVGSSDEASALAGALVERRLAACVQELPITSTYRWEGEVQRESEVLLLVKTTTEAVPRVQAAIEELHSYDVPEVVALAITGGLPAYLGWIGDEVG